MRSDRSEELENLVMVIYEEDCTVRARRELLSFVNAALDSVEESMGITGGAEEP